MTIECLFECKNLKCLDIKWAVTLHSDSLKICYFDSRGWVTLHYTAGCPLKKLTQPLKSLSLHLTCCLMLYKNLLNFTCTTKKFHNNHHTNDHARVALLQEVGKYYNQKCKHLNFYLWYLCKFMLEKSKKMKLLVDRFQTFEGLIFSPKKFVP